MIKDMSQHIFENIAEMVKVLAHPGRLEIIHLLRNHTLTVGQMTQMLAVRQAYVSQQLMLLKEAKLVISTRSGKEMYYELTDPRITVACDNLHSLVSDTPLSPSPEPTVIDPICQMKLRPSVTHLTAEYNGVRHYFCGLGCLKNFNLSHGGNL